MLAHADTTAYSVQAVAAVASVAVYVQLWMRRARRGRVRPTGPIAWSAGTVTALVAVSPPFERVAGETFTAHMLQHLLVIEVAAPLLAIAAPAELWRAAHPRTPMPTAHHRSGLRRFAPLVAATAFVVTLLATHLTGFYDAALRHSLLHAVEHLAYLGAAYAMWSTVRAASARRSVQRIAAVLVTGAGTAVVSMVLLAGDRPVVATYERALGRADALADQHAAAALMWVGGMAATLPLLVLAVWRAATAEQRATERREALTETPALGGPDGASASPEDQPGAGSNATGTAYTTMLSR